MTKDQIDIADMIARVTRTSVPDAAVDYEDRVSDARLAMLIAEREYDPSRGEFKQFAGRVVRNYLRDRTRQSMRRRFHPITDYETDDSATSVDASDAAEVLMGGLQPEQAAVIRLKFWDGKSFREIAEALGISMYRVKLLWSEAKEAMRGHALVDGIVP